MSNYLKIGKNGNLYLDGNLITTDDIEDINEYLMQLLGFYSTIDENVSIGEIVHSLFGMKKFIGGYFSEDYEIVRAFTSSAKLDKKYKAIKFFKSFKVENENFTMDEEYLYVLPEIAFIEALPEEVGYNKLGDLPVIIDESILLKHNEIELKLKSKFTLLDILTCIFDEMSYCLKSGNVITVA